MRVKKIISGILLHVVVKMVDMWQVLLTITCDEITDAADSTSTNVICSLPKTALMIKMKNIASTNFNDIK